MSSEIAFIQELQTFFHTPIKVGIAVFCARWMIFLFAPLAAATSFDRRRHTLRHAAIEAAWAGLLAITVATIMSAIIGRARPFQLSSDVLLFIPSPASLFAFPSAHTSVVFAIASALMYGDKRLGIVALMMASLVAMGRVVVGVHYPSDVVAGIVVGVGSFLFVRHMHGVLRRRAKVTPTM